MTVGSPDPLLEPAHPYGSDAEPPMTYIRSAFLATIFALALPAGPSVAEDAQMVRQSFDVAVPYEPSPVPISGRRTLVYELHLTNFSTGVLRIERVSIANARNDEAFFSLGSEQLISRIQVLGQTFANPLDISSGARAIVYLEVPLPDGMSPASIRHFIEYAATDGPYAGRGTITSGEVGVDIRPLPVLSPPLRGGPWVAVYEPGLERGHRRVFYAVDGKARLPGRFAIDWMAAGPKQGGQGPSGLGSEVLAVADGVVVSTKDGVPQPGPDASRQRVLMGDATGNYVSIRIADGRYAFYEHLMPGLRVRPGERVRRGQVIGQLGSTGSVTQPHLHFHIADANSALASESQPYVLTGATPLGCYRSMKAFEAGELWQIPLGVRDSPEFPAPNAVLQFDGQAGATSSEQL